MTFAGRLLVVAGLAIFLSGCAFTGLRREPTPIPTAHVSVANTPGAFRAIPVSIDMSDCVEFSMVAHRGIFGGNSFNGTFPLRKIIKREFDRMIQDVFRTPGEGDRERVMLKVYSKRVVVTQRGSKSECEITLDLHLIDPLREDVRPYFRGSFTRMWTCRHKDDAIVPGSVYETIHGIAKDFVTALAADGMARRRLDEVVVPEGRATPTLTSIRFRESAGGKAVAGECQVACNGVEGFEADRWARAQINASCQMKLGVEAERVRVVYKSDDYDAQLKRWTYRFIAFVRAPLTLDYDPETRSGTCVGDLGLLGLGANEAAEKMKRYVISEMRARGGAVSSVEGNLETRVRFDAFSSDIVNNQITMKFRLVY